MSTPLSISDLRNAFYGGSIDSEYDFLVDAAAAGVTAASLVAKATGNGYGDQEAYARILADQATVAGTSQLLRLVYFTAYKTETISNLVVASGSTGAGATPTVCRLGIYSEAANGDLTLIGSTPNDTTLFSSTNTVYTKAMSASVDLVAGTRYALGVLVVTAATAPTFVGRTLNSSATNQATPRIVAQRASQSDLPSSITNANLANTGSALWAAVTV
jgi:hypothetical protein